MNRRDYLAGVGAAASVGLAGCGARTPAAGGSGNQSTGNQSSGGNGMPPAAINPEQYAGAFDRVVNMQEAGADPTGEEDVSPIIEDELRDGALLVFPQGRYKMNSQVARRGGRDMGLIGQNAVLTHGRVDDIKGFNVTEGEFEGKAQHFKIGNGTDAPHYGKFVFGGFIADWRRENSGMQILNHHTIGESVVRNIKQVGMHSLGCQGPFRLNPASEPARIRASNLDIRHGGLTFQKTINDRETRSLGGDFGRSLATSGITMHPQTRGFLRVENSLVGGWPDNGIYCVGGNKTQTGTVEVVGCVAANSHPSNIRIGGDGSLIKGCTVVVDKQFGEYYFSQRPVRIDNGSCRMENTRILQKNPTGWGVTVQHAVKDARLKNIYLEQHNKPQLALVIDDTVGYCSVKDFEIVTRGFSASTPALIRGRGDEMVDVSINGETVAG